MESTRNKIPIASWIMLAMALVALTVTINGWFGHRLLTRIIYGPMHNVTVHEKPDGKPPADTPTPVTKTRMIKDMVPGEVGYTYSGELEKGGYINPYRYIEKEPSHFDDVKIMRTSDGFEIWMPGTWAADPKPEADAPLDPMIETGCHDLRSNLTPL